MDISSWTPTLSASMVAQSRAATPGNPFEDHVGNRRKSQTSEMSRGIRSLIVKDIKEKKRKGKGRRIITDNVSNAWSHWTITNRGILVPVYESQGTEEDFIVETQEVCFPLVDRDDEKGEYGQVALPPAAYSSLVSDNVLSSGDVQVCLSCFLTQTYCLFFFPWARRGERRGPCSWSRPMIFWS